MAWFEAACVAVIGLTLAAMARTRPVDQLLRDYAVLAVAAWIGEESCVAWYDFYHYAPAWHVRLDRVPVLVPLIWPLVILSARQVTRALRPGRGVGRAIAVGAVVAFDASLVEVIAVRAKLWGWAEPGHLGVPVIGILGWGFFAMTADLVLQQRWRWRRLALIVAAPAGAHLLILASWWGLFRWTVRGDLGDSSVAAVLVIGALATLWVARRRAAGYAIPLETALPRVTAAVLFLILLLTTAPADLRLWLHVVALSVPYTWASNFAPSPTRS